MKNRLYLSMNFNFVPYIVLKTLISKSKMDKTTKNILIIAVLIVGGVIALQFVFTYWWTFLFSVVTFIVGYFIGKKNRDY